MYKYSFQTKEMSHIFDNVKQVVNNSSFKIECPINKAKVVKMFDNETLFIAMDISVMPDVMIVGLNSDTTGNLMIDGYTIGFSVHDDILYLRKNIIR